MKNIHREDVKHPHTILEVSRFRNTAEGLPQFDVSASVATHWVGRCPHCAWLHSHGYSQGNDLKGLGSRSAHCPDYDLHTVRTGRHPEGWYFLVPDRTRTFPEEVDLKAYTAYLKRIEDETGFDMREYKPENYPRRFYTHVKSPISKINTPA